MSRTLRERLADNGYAMIKRFFPDGEPKMLWSSVREDLVRG